MANGSAAFWVGWGVSAAKGHPGEIRLPAWCLAGVGTGPRSAWAQGRRANKGFWVAVCPRSAHQWGHWFPCIQEAVITAPQTRQTPSQPWLAEKLAQEEHLRSRPTITP